MEILFSNSSAMGEEKLREWLTLVQKECFSLQPQVTQGGEQRFAIERALRRPISLTRTTAHTQLVYRRTWPEIRKNKVGLRLIFFIRRGSITIARPGNIHVANMGELAIVDPDTPFDVTMIGNEDQVHESIQLLVPAHLFFQHLQIARTLNAAIPMTSAEGEFADRLIDLLLGKASDLREETISPLVASLLSAIGGAIDRSSIRAPFRESLNAKRLSDIRNEILMDLADPALTFEKVAARCGISVRHMSYVLRVNNTSFTEILWSNRLQMARDWLVNSATYGYSVQEVAYMSGFKSAAHFGRAFKTLYGRSPGEYRARHQQLEGAGDEPGEA